MTLLNVAYLQKKNWQDNGIGGYSKVLPLHADCDAGSPVELRVMWNASSESSGWSVYLLQGVPDDQGVKDDHVALTSLPDDLTVEQLESLLAALLLVPAPPPAIKEIPQWQPIESAPKDGTEVLLLVEVGYRKKLGRQTVYRKGKFHGDHWYLDGWRVSNDPLNPETPTHWQPLPLPPGGE